MIVLDASAAVEILLRTPAGRPWSERMLAPDETLHAPHLLDVEVASALRRLSGDGAVETDRAEAALVDLADLPLERYDHGLLLARAWELRRNLTVYDGLYVALAELLGAPLLTRDARIERAPDHAAEVRLF